MSVFFRKFKHSVIAWNEQYKDSLTSCQYSAGKIECTCYYLSLTVIATVLLSDEIQYREHL
jgi:hypothetical protein